MEPDRLPPHSEVAEMGVIGCCLLAGHDAIAAVEERFTRAAAMMFDLRHGDIYKVMLDMWRERLPIDILTVQQVLIDRGLLGQVGGLPRLLEIQDSVPSPAHLPEYMEILHGKHVLRRIIQACDRGAAAAYETAWTESEAALDALEREITAIRTGDGKTRGINDTRQTLDALITDYEAAHAKTALPGIQTGFADLDKMIAGLMPQQIILLGGSPSAGKTSLALNIAAHYVFRLAGTVGIFSLETSAKKILHRLICAEFRVNGAAVMTGDQTAGDFERLTAGMQSVQAKRENIIVCDAGGLTVNRITSYARTMHQRGARLFIVDYLQLIGSPEKTPTEKVTAISIGLKNMAKELDCPVIAVSSLSLDAVKTGRAPTIGDLRQSGQLGYDADMVWLLHCADPNQELRETTLNVAKSKDTGTGEVKLMFSKSFYRFHNHQKYYDNSSEL